MNVVCSRLNRSYKTVYTVENVLFSLFSIISINDITECGLCRRSISIISVCPTVNVKHTDLRICLLNNNYYRNLTSKMSIVFCNNECYEILACVIKGCNGLTVIKIYNSAANRFISEGFSVKLEIGAIIGPGVVFFCNACNGRLRLFYNYGNLSINNIVVISILGSKDCVEDILTCYVNSGIFIFPLISLIKRNVAQLKISAPGKCNNLREIGYRICLSDLKGCTYRARIVSIINGKRDIISVSISRYVLNVSVYNKIIKDSACSRINDNIGKTVLLSIVYNACGRRVYINTKHSLVYIKNNICFGFVIARILRDELCSEGILSCITYKVLSCEFIVSIIPNPYTVRMVCKLDRAEKISVIDVVVFLEKRRTGIEINALNNKLSDIVRNIVISKIIVSVIGNILDSCYDIIISRNKHGRLVYAYFQCSVKNVIITVFILNYNLVTGEGITVGNGCIIAVGISVLKKNVNSKLYLINFKDTLDLTLIVSIAYLNIIAILAGLGSIFCTEADDLNIVRINSIGKLIFNAVKAAIPIINIVYNGKCKLFLSNSNINKHLESLCRRVIGNKYNCKLVCSCISYRGFGSLLPLPMAILGLRES